MNKRYSKVSIAVFSGVVFLLGGPFVPDTTPEAVNQVNQFIKENADIVAEHMESIPWAEALSGAPFNEHLMNDWRSRKSNVPKNATIYLAVSPGRGALGDYWGATGHDPMPAQFKGKAFNDPIVKQAYLSYCKRAVDFFQPEYLGIGIEVHEIASNDTVKTA